MREPNDVKDGLGSDGFMGFKQCFDKERYRHADLKGWLGFRQHQSPQEWERKSRSMEMDKRQNYLEMLEESVRNSYGDALYAVIKKKLDSKRNIWL